VFKTGSDANPLDKPGLANFTAAMLDEGAGNRNALQIADELARLGGSLATNSSMDSTTINARSLTSTFPSLLDLMADVVLRPAFPADEIERQRANRVAQLIQQRDNPQAVAATVTAAALYGTQHPYGYSEVGTEAAVKAMTREDMLAFWKQNYVPNNAALVVAGDISMKELRALAEKAFAQWQRGTPARPQLGAPATTQAKIVIVDKPGPQTQLRVASIGAARSSSDFRPLQVTNLALGGLFSSRINMNLREKNGYSYGANSQFTFRRAPGPFQVSSAVRLDATADATREIFNEVRGMTDRPVTAEELRGAKDALINSLPGAFETSAAAVGNFANTFIYDLGIDYYANYAEEVQAVTREQALAVTKKYLVPGSMTVVAVGDRKAIEPEMQKLNIGAIEIRDAEGRPSK
jgi:zinc protease